MNEIAVYLHWPFCVAKCPYCDFASYPAARESSAEYESLLLEDLQRTMEMLDVKSVCSVFFGGGTPSLMSVQSIENIINFLAGKLLPDAEISLEANPATFDKPKIKDMRTAGINRFSLGVQSFQTENLTFLGRIYSGEQAKKSAELAAAGFDNFSFDFMYGYQSAASVERDLQTAMSYGVRHVSCYQLTLEPGTPFFARFSQSGGLQQFDGADYMDFIEDFLHSQGIFRYEISNFARPKYESRHNLTYWNYGNYLGCGPSAHSRLIINGEKHAMTKCSNLKQWRAEIGAWDTDCVLSYEEQLEEMIITGLRKVGGVGFHEIFQRIPAEIVRKIITEEKLNFLKKYELIFPEDGKIQLTSAGLMKLNAVIGSLFE